MNPNNACAGKYKDTLDIKLTDICNGTCPFCIEKGGRKSQAIDVERLIDAVRTINPLSVLVLGGEPFLYNELQKFLAGIAPRLVYITTNGSKLYDLELVKNVAKHITGINISLMHYDMKLHKELTGIDLKLDSLAQAIEVFKNVGVKVRINVNLVAGYLDNREDVLHMVSFAKILGADEVRFAELQNCPEYYVDATTIFDNISNEPCKEGCEKRIIVNGVSVVVRTTCGYVNPDKPLPKEEIPIIKREGVMYPDAKVFEGWLKPNSDVFGGNCHNNNSCH
jgi:molybdenum cofactor biosynthesis enzyme MoaA